MPKTPDPEMIDDDAPELDADFWRRARPAAEVHGPAFMERARNKGGRPRKDNPKRLVSIRFDPEVVDHLEATGPGWRVRLNDAVRSLIAAGKL